MTKTISLKKEEIYTGTLLLVNAQHSLIRNQADSLSPVDIRFSNILLKREAANILRLILKKIGSGNQIVPVSGYRSLEEQESIYNNSLRENGMAFTKKYVALPNHSEHQTGLAIDLGLSQEEIDFICPDFPYEGICHEFRKAAPHYGFIERYAKDKEWITGISHEPWHFRYVGYPHSKIITDSGLSLEEYIDFIKDYREDCRLIYKQAYGENIEIYYVPAREEDEICIAIPETSLYQISGNNIDGFIVTVWRKNNEGKNEK